jgi:heterokaryon incompatibility protein (HET)
MVNVALCELDKLAQTSVLLFISKRVMNAPKVPQILRETLHNHGKDLSEVYVYAPLLHTQPQIRLLQVCYQPDAAQPVACKLITFDTEDAPPYTALSYTWGSAVSTQTIRIGRSSLTIRKNLHAFLNVIRNDLELCLSTWFWIDQLCIDQSNYAEKAYQVHQMPLIFNGAVGVIVWLGTAFEGSDDLIAAISAPSFDGKIPQKNKAAWRTFVDLEYWKRLWICQEFLLARSFSIFLGHRRTGGEYFFKCVLNEFLPLWAYILPGTRMGRRERIIRLYNARDIGIDGSWASALALSRRTLCQDKHDRIYGLLGLVKSELKVYPDYLRSMRDVFFDVLRLEMQNKSLDQVPSPDHDVYEHMKYDEFLAFSLYRDLNLDRTVTHGELRRFLHVTRSNSCPQCSASEMKHAQFLLPWLRLRRWFRFEYLFFLALVGLY